MAECDAVTLHPCLLGRGRPDVPPCRTGRCSPACGQALLVNAARGPVVDSGALLEELRAGRIRAVLDTWEGEPIVKQRVALADRLRYVPYSRIFPRGKAETTRMALEALERDWA